MSQLADEPTALRGADGAGHAGRATTPAPSSPAPNGDAAPAEVSLGRRFLDLRTLASFGVALGVLFVAVTQVFRIDVERTLRTLAQADVGLFALGLLAYYLVFPIRALRWRRILANAGSPPASLPSTARLAEIIFLSWFANCLVPAKLGDVYRAYLLKRWGGVSGSKAGGTIVAERVLDLATLLCLAGLAGLASLWGQPREKLAALVGPLEAMGVVVGLAALGLVTMRFWSGWLRTLLPSRVHGFYARFEEGALGSFGSFHVLVPYSLLAWVPEALRLFFVTRALGLTMADSLPRELAMVTAVALVGSLLTALPLTPAGLGFVESGVLAALLLLGVRDEGLALSAAILDRAISYASLVLFGLVVYLLSARLRTRPPG